METSEDWLKGIDTLGDLLQKRAGEDGSHTFAYCRGGPLNLAELDQRSNRVADSLVRRGVKKGDRVSFISHTTSDYLVAEFAVLKAGAVCVPMNCNLKANDFDYFIRNSGSSVVLVHYDYLQEFEASAAAKSNLACFVMGHPPGSGMEGKRFEELLEGDADPPKVKVGYDDNACLLYTSGTTGAPKAVVYEHFGLLPKHGETYVQQMQDAIALSSSDITYLPFPLYHILGQAHLASALRNRGKIAFAERFSVRAFWDDVRRYDATVLVHQGASIPLLLKQEPSKMDKKHHARVTVGAGVPSADVWRRFEERFNVKVFEHYAQTEGAFFGAGTVPTNKVGTIGLSYATADIRIVDEKDQDVPEGETGQLVSRLKPGHQRKDPKNLYFGEAQKSLSRFTEGGWFRSGDAVFRDGEGYLHYVGKVETFIRYRGENISPLQIESVVNNHPSIEECVAVGVPNRDLGGDDIKLVVLLKRGADVEPPDLVEWCSTRLPRFMVPRYVEFVADLKRSPQTSKVIRSAYLEVTGSTWDRLERKGEATGSS